MHRGVGRAIKLLLLLAAMGTVLAGTNAAAGSASRAIGVSVVVVSKCVATTNNVDSLRSPRTDLATSLVSLRCSKGATYRIATAPAPRAIADTTTEGDTIIATVNF